MTAGDRAAEVKASFLVLVALLLLSLSSFSSAFLAFLIGVPPSENEKAEDDIGATLFPFPLSGGCILRTAWSRLRRLRASVAVVSAQVVFETLRRLSGHLKWRKVEARAARGVRDQNQSRWHEMRSCSIEC